MTLHVLGIPGSLRKASYNKGLLRVVVELAPADMTVDVYARLGDMLSYQ